MKIVSLNLWGGKIKVPLRNFLNKYKEDIDMFCFQEMIHHGTKETMGEKFQDMDSSLYSNISKILTDHRGYFRPEKENNVWGLAIFIRKNILVKQEGEITILETKNYESGEGTKKKSPVYKT